MKTQPLDFSPKFSPCVGGSFKQAVGSQESHSIKWKELWGVIWSGCWVFSRRHMGVAFLEDSQGFSNLEPAVSDSPRGTLQGIPRRYTFWKAGLFKQGCPGRSVPQEDLEPKPHPLISLSLSWSGLDHTISCRIKSPKLTSSRQTDFMGPINSCQSEIGMFNKRYI